MIPHVLLVLATFAQGATTNTTSSDCPSCDATACSYRSVLGILASCGVTLLICVWHAVHPDIPLPHWKWNNILLDRLGLVLLAFFVPELLMMDAFIDWFQARLVVDKFHEEGYGWTMTHSHFALMGGFVYREDRYSKEIDGKEFLELVGQKKITNPVITVEDIRERSNSDWLGKAILIVQLFWFTIQVVVRGANHLAVTLIELDTLCMAVLTLPLFFFWWHKPMGCQRPHIFYSPDVTPPENPKTVLQVFVVFGCENYSLPSSSAFKDRPSDGTWSWMACLSRKTMSGAQDDDEKTLVRSNDSTPIHTARRWGRIFFGRSLPDASDFTAWGVLFGTWVVLGGLHLIAWNFDFPTVAERTTWRAASLVLVVSPMLIAGLILAGWIEDFLSYLLFFCLFAGVICRMLLVSLMLASLRALPASAYQTISWTTYIPHL